MRFSRNVRAAAAAVHKIIYYLLLVRLTGTIPTSLVFRFFFIKQGVRLPHIPHETIDILYSFSELRIITASRSVREDASGF